MVRHEEVLLNHNPEGQVTLGALHLVSVVIARIVHRLPEHALSTQGEDVARLHQGAEQVHGGLGAARAPHSLHKRAALAAGRGLFLQQRARYTAPMEVRIIPQAMSAMQSGRGRLGAWVLESPPGKAAPEAEMGWAAGHGTGGQIRLTFGSRKEAQDYAQARGWRATVLAPQARMVVPRSFADTIT